MVLGNAADLFQTQGESATPASRSSRIQHAKSLAERHLVWTPREHIDRNSIFSLRFSTRVLPKASRPHKKETPHDYMPPPPPPPLKQPPPKRAEPVSVEELDELAQQLDSEVDGLQASRPEPSLRVRFGLLLLSKDDFIKRILKDWDTKGRGEFLKGEFRLNLRNLGLNVTSTEADNLFDSWDDDGGGSLDLKELRSALLGVQQAGRAYQSTPDSTATRATALRRRAELAREAAQVSGEATRLEEEYRAHLNSCETRADVQLGLLLSKRRIKAGAMVAVWSQARGPHAGELSKADFRSFCVSLNLPPITTVADIERVFDMYDEDGGGYMDEGEARDMIRGLQQTAEKVELEGRVKQRDARAMRAKATKLASVAMTPLLEERESPPEAVEPQPLPAPTGGGGSKGGATAKDKQRGLAGKGLQATTAKASSSSPSRADESEEEAKQHDLEVENTAKRVALRIANASLSRAFNQWEQVASERRDAMETIKAGASRWLNPTVTWGWQRWVEWAEMASERQYLRSSSSAFCNAYALVTAVRFWQTLLGRTRQRQMDLVQRSRRRLCATSGGSRQLLARVLHGWRVAMRVPHLNSQRCGFALLCSALCNCMGNPCGIGSPNCSRRYEWLQELELLKA